LSPLRDSNLILAINSFHGRPHLSRSFCFTSARWKAVTKKNLSPDAYAKAQRKRYEAAWALRRQLRAKPVDPQEAIHGEPTPFLASFTNLNLSNEPESTSSQAPLNYSLTPDEIYNQLATSRFLLSPSKALPVPTGNTANDTPKDENNAKGSAVEDAEGARHLRAEEALRRITALDHGSSADRLHWNVKRCIETFGRHNTDNVLEVGTGTGPNRIPRIGKDTGSSEVQIAILTAKIQVIAKNFKNKDKANKKNLRQMLHKRQKLLRYLHGKERGGPRWQSLVQTLGLTDAAWREQISI
jgi:ribosomal protein S15